MTFAEAVKLAEESKKKAESLQKELQSAKEELSHKESELRQLRLESEYLESEEARLQRVLTNLDKSASQNSRTDLLSQYAEAKYKTLLGLFKIERFSWDSDSSTALVTKRLENGSQVEISLMFSKNKLTNIEVRIRKRF